MPYTLEFELKEGVIVTWSGNVTGDEVTQAIKTIYLHDSKHQLRYQIWNFLGAAKNEVTVDQLSSFAFQKSLEAKYNPNQIIALVGSKNLFAGMDRLYKIFTGVWARFESESFNSLHDARAWISTKYSV